MKLKAEIKKSTIEAAIGAGVIAFTDTDDGETFDLKYKFKDKKTEDATVATELIRISGLKDGLGGVKKRVGETIQTTAMFTPIIEAVSKDKDEILIAVRFTESFSGESWLRPPYRYKHILDVARLEADSIREAERLSAVFAIHGTILGHEWDCPEVTV